ncbi:hypothetical protein Tco_0178669 [Tanacetum coccineum]
MTRASSKKLKTGGDDVNLATPSHGVPQEEAGATPSQNISQEEVAAPSHSQDIPNTQVEVPSYNAPSAQHTASSPKKVGTRKKRLGRKGVHTSHSTISIKDGDPEAEHKRCIKYASDADSDSDPDTPVNFYDVVDWELLPTGLGSINVFYRKDNSSKCFISLREILHLVTRADLMTIYGRVMTFYQDTQAAGVVSGLVLHMFVDKKYPLSVNLIERMLDHQLEICQGTIGNELTTAVQLIAFLKKQISDSRRPKVHDCCGGLHVADLELMKVAVKEYAFGFKMFLFNPLMLSKTDLSRNLKYVVPTGRVKVPTGRYVVPTSKDTVIVSTGRTKVIPAGKTKLVLTGGIKSSGQAKIAIFLENGLTFPYRGSGSVKGIHRELMVKRIILGEKVIEDSILFWFNDRQITSEARLWEASSYIYRLIKSSSFPTLKVNVSSYKSMRAFAVRRKSLPKIISTLGSGSKLTTTKSARKVKPSTLTTNILAFAPHWVSNGTYWQARVSIRVGVKAASTKFLVDRMK